MSQFNVKEHIDDSLVFFNNPDSIIFVPQDDGDGYYIVEKNKQTRYYHISKYWYLYKEKWCVIIDSLVSKEEKIIAVNAALSCFKHHLKNNKYKLVIESIKKNIYRLNRTKDYIKECNFI